ncbi:MAG: ABC-F family ATP-binding cassette domain-containing protein [Bacteroidetes bacterium]|nr:ABC-F family ATP-binding cassette domain-containing protein [Bacteroidota bacterium]
MNYLSVEQLSKSFGAKQVFDGLNFGIEKGEKVGLIARNGTGKSTLLRCLTGQDSPDAGIITFRNGLTLGYLAQKQNFNPELTVLETVFAGDSEQMQAIRAYELALEGSHEDETFYTALNDMERTQAWSYESNAKEILHRLGLEDMSKKMRLLSGGQQKRLSLALELLKSPDLLILDEPTNHLDLQMTEWLEDWLLNSTATLLMVTHDRFFLDNVCDTILELEDGQLFKHKGNYSYYLEKKQEREENQATVVSKAKSAMRKELEWIRRQPKARGTKAKYRVQAFEDLKETASKRLNDDEISLEINIPRMGSKVVELHKVSKGFDGKTLIKDLSYTFLRHEKVGVIGPNGTGKSTLLNLITGSLSPDKGKVVVGDTVVFGYFTQQGIQFKEGQRVIDTVKDIAEVIPLTKGQKITASQLLERFLFTKDMHYNLVDSLSGGEQRRLHLLKVLMNNPNFLILDEPTNDLDVFTLQILEEYLMDFPGVVLIVSHDRHFMDKLVDHCFVFEGEGTMRDFPGNYTQYRLRAAMEEKAKKENKRTSPVEKAVHSSGEKTKLTYAERMEFDGLDGEIDTLENKLKTLSHNLTQSNTTDELLSITEKIGEVQKELETKTQRWMYLAEFEM